MAYDSRTDRAKVTWEKKSERKRRHAATQRDTKDWRNERQARRWSA